MRDIGVTLAAFTCSAWLLAHVWVGGPIVLSVKMPITCTAENFASVLDPNSIPVGQALLYTVYDTNGAPLPLVAP